MRQALRSALPPPRKPASASAPRLGAHRETIREWLTADLSVPRKQRHTARRIWQRLVDERGASVAESTVRAYVGRVRREFESGRVTVTIPQLHPPGEEAEVDFGGVSVWLDGVLTELSMFVMRLSHSGLGTLLVAREPVQSRPARCAPRPTLPLDSPDRARTMRTVSTPTVMVRSVRSRV